MKCINLHRSGTEEAIESNTAVATECMTTPSIGSPMTPAVGSIQLQANLSMLVLKQLKDDVLAALK